MKTITTTILLGVLATQLTRAADETTTNAPALAEATAAHTPVTTVAVVETNAPVLLPNGEPGVRMNFRGVPLELVLNHLSEAAGFTIVLDTKVSGKIDAWSNHPLSKDEAVDLLNSVLNKNGYAAIRHGRTLTIVNKDEAKTKDIPVILESDPDKIPKTDEMVTQIMPVKFIEVGQLVKDLQPLVSTATTMTANEAGNSIIMTDTRANINRVAQIIRAIDQGAEDVTEVRVFHLEFADPTEMATLLTSLFADSSSSSGNSQNPVQFGGRGGGGGPFGGFFGRGGGGNDNSSGNSQAQRIKKRAKVTAIADPRTSSVIVSATSGLVTQIEEMIKQLDANPAKKQKVYVYQVNPGDVSQVQQVLEDMFETTTSNNRNSRNNSSLQNNVLQNRATQNQQTGTSSSSTTRSSNRNSGNSGFGGGGF
ncbi:MAG: secretin N-terminal domain-containing protein [Verrucomicrobiota bacterium]